MLILCIPLSNEVISEAIGLVITENLLPTVFFQITKSDSDVISTVRYLNIEIKKVCLYME